MVSPSRNGIKVIRVSGSQPTRTETNGTPGYCTLNHLLNCPLKQIGNRIIPKSSPSHTQQYAQELQYNSEEIE